MDFRHAAQVIGCVLVVPVIVMGCGPVASPEEGERNGELLEQVAAELRENDAYDTVEASYVDDVENQATVFIEIRCRTCVPDEAVDQAASLVWRSEITPLLGLTLSVSNLETNKTESLVAGLRAEEESLTRQYGERPVDSFPDE